MQADASPRLGDILRQAGLINDLQLSGALAQQAHERKRLGELLVDHGIIDGATCARALSVQLQLPLVDLDATPPEPDALKVLPRDVVERFKLMPLRVLRRKKVLQVASSEPNNPHAQTAVAFHSGLQLQYAICDTGSLHRAVLRWYYGEKEPASLSRLPSGITEPHLSGWNAVSPPPSERRLQQMERQLAQQSKALRSMLELLDAQGVIRREEFLARMSGTSSSKAPPPLPLGRTEGPRKHRLAAGH